MRYKTKVSGFTLIEIIVSLTLLGFIFLLLFSSLFTANKSWIAGEKKISQNDEIRLTAVFLRRQLTHTLPIMWINQKERNLLFRGQEDQLSFVSTLPAHRGGGGLNLITLKIEHDDEEQSNLVLEYRIINTETDRFKLNDDTEDKQNRAVLISRVENIEFAYFGSEEPNDIPQWHDDWTNKKNLPELIRLNMTSSSGMTWPQIEVALPVEFINGQPQFTIVSENEFPLS